VQFRPESRTVENSDYNQHYVDVEAPIEAELEYSSRADEVTGEGSKGLGRQLVPTGAERLRGAVVAAGVGDAFARNFGSLTKYPWYSGGAVNVEEKLIDYLPDEEMWSSWVTQMMAYTAEGLIRAMGGRHAGGQVDPLSTVQHAYQRWLYYMRYDYRLDVKQWPTYGGVYARYANEMGYPDGIVVKYGQFRMDRDPDPAVLEALLDFASTGIRSTPADPRSTARGADVLVRAALAAVWSEDLSETFELGAAIAALTHPHPDDYLAAGTLAVVVHQQIREQPFMDCLTEAWRQLVARPGHERTQVMIDTAVELVRNEWTPTQADTLRRHFPDGGVDGAEALGIALYCAMVSDYLREALVLALNYADKAHRPQVTAAAGMLIGAEYGIHAVPKVFRDPVDTADPLDGLAMELATELRDVLTKGEWQRRYPPV
jgi:ADP-ribosylglycohydrolase